MNTEAKPVTQDRRFPSRGGDRGGRRPKFAEAQTRLIFGSEISDITRMAGPQRRNAFIRRILICVAAMGAGWEVWDIVHQHPERFKRAIEVEIDKIMAEQTGYDPARD